MKIITVNVSEKHLEFFDAVIEAGLYPSRSETLRHCIDLGVKEILGDLQLINKYLEIKNHNGNNKESVMVPNGDYSDVKEFKIVKRLEF
jgi:Arc/MetJ-type ribon-helix-helix transcriptional regulator